MSKIAIVGEAFGAKEAMWNHPFVGSSGVELAKMLHEANLGPELKIPFPSELDMISYWKLAWAEWGISLFNVFTARPEDNNIDLFFASAKEGSKAYPPLRPGKFVRPELIHHIESLHQNLTELKPNLIVALGNTACWATLGESKISTLRGTIKESPKLGIKVLPTYHPAAVLRQWNLRTVAVADLTKAKAESSSAAINRIERWLTIDPTLEEIYEWSKLPADYYAVDIETAFGQITMIGFARSPHDALVIPFVEKYKPGLNFWPTEAEEISAWLAVQVLLESPVPKIFQNGVYDLSYLLKAGFRPRNCAGDTMLLHHALYPEMSKGLGFLGSIYSNEAAWKTLREGQGNLLKRDE